MSFPKSPFSGFPFDDQDFDRERPYSFRSQLDDLAKRHPEFAKHLNFGNTQFPFRSHTLGRHRRGSSTENPSGSQDAEFRRYADRPFGSRFEQFGFPFSRHFDDEPDFYYAEQQPNPQQQHPEESQSPKEPSSPQPTTEKPPQSPHHTQERGRKQNIQQSNTVDLGQKQDPVDENRSQRSMSAPPENRSTGQRFVSSINIPIQRPGGGDIMGARSSQTQPEAQTQSHPQTQSRPNERVIPIHVEGRDEPVIPKNINTSQSAAPPRPHTEKVFGRNPAHFTQFVNKGEPHGFTPPEDAYRQQYQKQQQQPPQSQQPPTEQQQAPTQQQQQPQQKQPKPIQLDQIQIIQKDVSELMNKAQNFSGKLKDKEYLYLDEMLTRNLIKLDNIETEGKENIRLARKEAIKCIEECIGVLEAKANANTRAAAAAAAERGEEMEIEKPAETTEQPEKTAESEQPPTASDDLINAEKQHATDTEVTSLEISGVQRPGTMMVESAPMEVVPAENITKEEVPPSSDVVKTDPPIEIKETVEAQTPAAMEEVKTEQVLDVEPEAKREEEAAKAENMMEVVVVSQIGADEAASQDLTKESAQADANPEDKTEEKKEEKKEKKKGKKKEKTEKK